MAKKATRDNKLILVLAALVLLTVAALAAATYGWPYVQSLLSGGADSVGR
jgi:hypothetical protein